MGKVIKVIGLVNMKVNKEKMPKHIRINKLEYFYNENRKTYDSEYGEQMSFDFTDNVLNMEVEILDEEDEIDIQSIEEIYINDIKSIGISEGKCWTGRNLDIFLGNKINELLKAVKQLDNKLNKLESNT